MYSIRTTKTASHKTAIQIVQYRQRKTIVVKHIGSASQLEEIRQLKALARKWIEATTKQGKLFQDKKDEDHNLTPLRKYRYLGIRYFFSYEIINHL